LLYFHILVNNFKIINLIKINNLNNKKMIKEIYLILSISAGLFASQSVMAQNRNMGIGTSNPDPSAALEIQSPTQGFLVPRMSSLQKDNISNPAQGLMIYQIDQSAGFYFYNGTKWAPLSETDAKSIATANPDNWSITGNTAVSGNFIGTNNNENLLFKVGGTNAGLLSVDNRTLFGLLAGQNSASGSHNTAIGFLALQSNTSGIRNTAIGSRALNLNTGSDNLALGMDALQNNTSGGNNTAIGFGALNLNQGGGLNVGIGAASLGSQTAGDYNVGLGFGAGYGNNTGSGNIALGAYSLFSPATRTNTLAIGFQAGRNATGSDNVFIGNSAGYSETGNSKLYISNSNTTTPLIYGDFSAKYVTIGDVTPAQRSQGIAASSGYNLLVKGGILTEKVKVAVATTADWADYVFEDSYKTNLMKLEDVEKFTIINKHLPNVPSAQEMVNNGMEFGETSKMFMEKIEELTLYLIELKKEINELKATNAKLLK
jgi:hypothetical protein